jgi:hypothetical protein
MVVDGNGQSFLGLVLPNAIKVEMLLDVGRLGDLLDAGRRFFLFGKEFLIEDVLAKDDAVVADVNAGTGDELLDFSVRFSAETAEGQIGWPRHTCADFG